jgi:hypothetical protein
MMQQPAWIWLIGTLLFIVLLTAFAPVERTLGARARLVYLHGAWVWSGKVAFGLAALAGLAGLWLRKERFHQVSQALARTGLLFWLTYLPMSLLVQQMNWGGIFWDEPRWRIPLAFGIAGLLLQIGLTLMADLRLASAANFVFGAALWYLLGNIENVLHPDSPVFGSGAVRIELYFSLLLMLALFMGAQLTRLFFNAIRPV